MVSPCKCENADRGSVLVMFDFADVDSPRPCMSTLAGNARGNPTSIPPVQASQGSEPSLVPCEERSSSFVCSARSLLIVSSSSLMVVALSSRSRFAATSASRVLASASATSFFRFFSAVSRSSFRFCSTMATSAVLLFSASARSSFSSLLRRLPLRLCFVRVGRLLVLGGLSAVLGYGSALFSVPPLSICSVARL